MRLPPKPGRAGSRRPRAGPNVIIMMAGRPPGRGFGVSGHVLSPLGRHGRCPERPTAMIPRPGLHSPRTGDQSERWHLYPPRAGPNGPVRLVAVARWLAVAARAATQTKVINSTNQDP